MKILVAGIATVAVVLSAVPADARRGGFLSALVRGGVHSAAPHWQISGAAQQLS
jgi:hypothetical protein